MDDVVRNVLPRYTGDEIHVDDTSYEADIRRILTAFGTDSKAQRDKLLAALRETRFLRAVKASDGSKWWATPRKVYLATERLKELFAGVADVLVVDDSYGCLRGEDVRELLEACGSTRYLQPVKVATTFTWEQLRQMRVAAGCESMSSEEPVEDQTLRGLGGLLAVLAQLDPIERARKAALVWEALGDLEDRRGTGVFSGVYRWYYYHRRSTTFDAAFVRKLNETAWVPDANGELQRPEFILFDTLGWKPNPFLQAKIPFKPPIIEALAREAGIESGVLDLLKKLGVTSVAELRDRLGLKDEPAGSGDGAPDNVGDALKQLIGDAPDPTPPVLDPAGADRSVSGGQAGVSGAGTGARSGHGASASDHRQGEGLAKGSEADREKRPPEGVNGRPFISYLGAHPDDDEPDPDGLGHSARMALEAQALELIIAREPAWQRTPTQNPGYDLFQPGEDGSPPRWCEVKAMTGSLHDRPAGLSRTQFACAQEHGQAYWLYVVEHVGTDSARIVRIQDPAGQARTFTFDQGWLAIAQVDSEQKDEGD